MARHPWRSSSRRGDRRRIEYAEVLMPLADLDGMVDGDIAERLAGPACRPGDFKRPHHFGLAQSDRTGQWIAAKARAGRDGPVPRYVCTVGTRQINPDLGTEGRPVRPGPHELDSQPMVAVPRVLKQNIMSPVARGRATGLHEDVGVAITVPVGEGHAMTLLEVTGPRHRGDV